MTGSHPNAVAGAPLPAQLEIPAPSVPAPSAAGEYRIDVALLYRKVDQFLLNYLLGATNTLTAPVTEIARTRLTVSVKPQQAQAPEPDAPEAAPAPSLLGRVAPGTAR